MVQWHIYEGYETKTMKPRHWIHEYMGVIFVDKHPQV